MGRNTYLGDPLRSVDMRLSRTVHFTEKYRLQLAVDAFNLLNRPNVNEVSTVYGAPDFAGPVPKHYKDGIAAPNSSFGSPVSVFNPRQLQFSAKLLF